MNEAYNDFIQKIMSVIDKVAFIKKTDKTVSQLPLKNS